MSLENLANTYCEQFAKQIRSLRLECRWNREDLAEFSDVNVFTLKLFERTGQISLKRFIKLCVALDSLREFKELVRPDIKALGPLTVRFTSNRLSGQRKRKV